MRRPKLEDAAVIPILEERLHVEKKLVPGTAIRVRKDVETVEKMVDIPAITRSYDIRRVPINREISEAPEVRKEGDVVIFPVIEEVLFVEKRLMLREEIRVIPKRSETRSSKKFKLRREHATVERKKIRS